MLPRLYTDLAEWWPLLSAPADYAHEAKRYTRLIQGATDRPPTTVLELGSGGGNNASHMKRDFTLTLVDRSPGMLAVSARLNPECEHLPGDMRSVRLDRTFDAVFVHDAVSYLTSLDDLAAMARTARVHLARGGVLLIAPDEVRESFDPSTEHGGHDEGARGVRYLEWTWQPDPTDHCYTTDMVYVLRHADGSIETVHDRHEFGLFAIPEWIATLEAAGFEARCLEEPLEAGASAPHVFVARATA